MLSVFHRWGIAIMLAGVAGSGCGACPSTHARAQPPPGTARDATSDPTDGRGAPPTADPATSLLSIGAEDLRRHVEFLASDAMRGRPTPSPELNRAADYIIEEFQHAGLEPLPGASSFEQRFDCGGGSESANVLGYRSGSARNGQAIIVSAHYDHIGQSKAAAEDRIFNGANDNASGVAVMLTIAKAMAGQPHARSIIFVAFCGEELGLLGSRYYVQHPLWPLENTTAVVNLEMLGRPTASPATAPVIAWITGDELSTFSEHFVDPGNNHGVRFSSARDIGPQEGNAFNRSDNYPFASAGVVAHTIASGTIDAYYHAVHDEANSLDYPRMAQIARALAAGVLDLANAEEGPHWAPTHTAAELEAAP